MTATNTPFMPTSINRGGGAAPFSLTEVVTIVTGAVGQNFSLDAQLSYVPQPVPEPDSLALLALPMSLAGVIVARRRRNTGAA